MKQIERKDTPEISGGFIVGDVVTTVDPDYPQTPIGPIGPTCPPIVPEELVR